MLLNAPEVGRRGPKAKVGSGLRRALLMDGDQFERTAGILRSAVAALWPADVERMVAASAMATDPEWLANAMGVMTIGG